MTYKRLGNDNPYAAMTRHTTEATPGLVKFSVNRNDVGFQGVAQAFSHEVKRARETEMYEDARTKIGYYDPWVAVSGCENEDEPQKAEPKAWESPVYKMLDNFELPPEIEELGEPPEDIKDDMHLELVERRYGGPSL